MSKRPSLKLNGKEYPITKTKYGLTLVDGKPCDEFVDWLAENDTEGFAEIVKKGIQVVVEKPEGVGSY